MRTHLLAFLIAMPLIVSVLIAIMPRGLVALVKPLSVFVALLELATGGYYLLSSEFVGGRPALAETYGWVWDTGLSLAFEVDGLSMPLVLLAIAITPVALVAGFPEKRSRLKGWAIGIFVMEAGLVTAFVARDLLVFYVGWELVLLPLYLFVVVWGGRATTLTANRFFLYTLAGSLLMLVAIVYTGGQYAALSPRPSFLLSDLERLSMPLMPQALCFGAFAIAFAIKMPLFPMHAWSPETYRDAPIGAVIMASAVMAKLGSYGFLRFAATLYPLGAQYVGPTLAVLAVVGIIYGALIAMRQDDARVMLAYSSMSHMGFIALGIFSLTPVGLSGSVFQMVSHGISTAGLFLVVDAIERRTGTRSIAELAGLANVAPRLATTFVLIALAAVAIPTTSGFVGETMILSGSFGSSAQAGFGAFGRFFAMTAALGVVFGAMYVLSLVQKVVWGETNDRTKGVADLDRGELTLLVPFVVLAFGLGVAPKFLLDVVDPAAAQATMSFDMRWGAARSVEVTEVAAPAAPAPAPDDEAAPPAAPPTAPAGEEAGHAPIPPTPIAPGGAR